MRHTKNTEENGACFQVLLCVVRTVREMGMMRWDGFSWREVGWRREEVNGSLQGLKVCWPKIMKDEIMHMLTSVSSDTEESESETVVTA